MGDLLGILPRITRICFARITVSIGPPIHLTPEEIKAARGKEDYERIAKRIMAAIQALGGIPND